MRPHMHSVHLLKRLIGEAPDWESGNPEALLSALGNLGHVSLSTSVSSSEE